MEVNMQVVLENEALKVTINSFGAELASIQGKQQIPSICGMRMQNFGRELPRYCFPL